MYRSEAAEIRRLLADGWRYSTCGVEPRDHGHVLPYLTFSKSGRDRPMYGNRLWRSHEAAWQWCRAWADRAVRWDEDRHRTQ